MFAFRQRNAVIGGKSTPHPSNHLVVRVAVVTLCIARPALSNDVFLSPLSLLRFLRGF